MRKKFFITAALALMAFCAKSQTYSYLIFTEADGAQSALKADELTITFSDSQALVNVSGTTHQFSLASLASMRFATEEEVTGVKNVALGADSSQPARVYTVDGRFVTSLAAGETNLAARLPRGLYVVKRGAKAEKLFVR